MIRLSLILVLVLSLIGFLVLPVNAGIVPTKPETATLISEKLEACTQPFYPELYIRGYDTDGKTDLYEIGEYGLFNRDKEDEDQYGPALIQIHFKPGVRGVVTDVYVQSAPGVVTRYPSLAALKEAYPGGPCDVIVPALKAKKTDL